jgi:hypothetical protein
MATTLGSIGVVIGRLLSTCIRTARRVTCVLRTGGSHDIDLRTGRCRICGEMWHIT